MYNVHSVLLVCILQTKFEWTLIWCFIIISMSIITIVNYKRICRYSFDLPLLLSLPLSVSSFLLKQHSSFLLFFLACSWCAINCIRKYNARVWRYWFKCIDKGNAVFMLKLYSSLPHSKPFEWCITRWHFLLFFPIFSVRRSASKIFLSYKVTIVPHENIHTHTNKFNGCDFIAFILHSEHIDERNWFRFDSSTFFLCILSQYFMYSVKCICLLRRMKFIHHKEELGENKENDSRERERAREERKRKKRRERDWKEVRGRRRERRIWRKSGVAQDER